MTDTQIVERNRAIAEFMGWSFYDEGLTPCVVDKEKNSIPVGELKYHSDWSQMHGVWHKLYHDYYEVSRRSRDPNKRLNASVFNENYIIYMEKAFLIGDKSAAHRILFEAIQWYNTQNKQQ